ncbi:hypothetical protein Y032_0005g2362 [Ancylostoma ceylanicum]|uniref:Uncharacterized protein n=1 Tax=Ancylostoma ceylanicum TaxID=53326 RepID=A0A016VRC5_9BILA|nr:hypothetical protein Y032_0005g2362 [Ancylostoma ceylanicum]
MYVYTVLAKKISPFELLFITSFGVKLEISNSGRLSRKRVLLLVLAGCLANPDTLAGHKVTTGAPYEFQVLHFYFDGESSKQGRSCGPEWLKLPKEVNSKVTSSELQRFQDSAPADWKSVGYDSIR